MARLYHNLVECHRLFWSSSQPIRKHYPSNLTVSGDEIRPQPIENKEKLIESFIQFGKFNPRTQLDLVENLR